MKHTLIVLAFLGIFALGIVASPYIMNSDHDHATNTGIGISIAPTPSVVHAQWQAGTVDPLLIVQDPMTKEISVYRSNDTVLEVLINSTPSQPGACNQAKTTCYVEGSPGLTNAITTVTDMLYQGINSTPITSPPAH